MKRVQGNLLKLEKNKFRLSSGSEDESESPDNSIGSDGGHEVSLLREGPGDFLVFY